MKIQLAIFTNKDSDPSTESLLLKLLSNKAVRRMIVGEVADLIMFQCPTPKGLEVWLEYVEDETSQLNSFEQFIEARSKLSRPILRSSG
jgi:hypothetical protein